MNDPLAELYKKRLIEQFRNVQHGALNLYFSDLYSEISSRLDARLHILEIGAGAGTSSIFLTNYDISRTDLIDSNPGLVRAGVDAHNLPEMDETYDSVIGLHTLHHLADPIVALKEMLRVLKPDGKIILIEPYVSAFSYLIYRIFHQEDTSIYLRKNHFDKESSKDPSTGNQIIGQTIFNRKLMRSELNGLLGNDYLVRKHYRDFLVFFSTGGINNPIKVNTRMIQIILSVEKRIPQKIMRLIGSTMVIVIEPKYP
jgi:SAM-dependent methyltransferase